ncbi:hypothetical protein PR202_ga27097 [Eleusine coracana subsp. coracana]|uniref:Uncharacterized protein n=1 Tax=Eleusine coracana subsp. coracana TaxID=191504 RepID=A0AAV5DDQ2_ELECO|nr:hypothetical protein PR202_ga27097 [Eleusine coracana subsp. coracana]
MALAAGKKARKPYTITRRRDKWTANEHGLFLHAMQLFGRDWKKVEQFVVTKSATQIHSHAQKHFLKIQKRGLTAAASPHPRFPPQPISNYHDNAAATTLELAHLEQSADWAPNCSEELAAASPSDEDWILDSSLLDETMIHLPLSPDDLHFAQVYRFIGDVFGSDALLLDEAQLQRLQSMDPVVVEAILLALRNLQVNLFV